MTLLDIDVRTRDIVAVLPAVEHGLLACIAAAIRIDLNRFRVRCRRRSGVADNCDIGDTADFRPVLFRQRAIGGIVGAIILGHTLAAVLLKRTGNHIRICIGSVRAFIILIGSRKIGIRILRLHRALHKGGEKRIRMPREDAPRLICAALVGDVPAGITFFLVSRPAIRRKVRCLQVRREIRHFFST